MNRPPPDDFFGQRFEETTGRSGSLVLSVVL